MDGEHWRQWWGEPTQELANVAAMLAGEDTTEPFIFHLAGRPAGYIQVWSIGDHQRPPWIETDPWLMALTPETVGVDIAIGAPDDLGRGIGPAVLSAFVARLRHQGHREIIIDPDPANTRAIRAYRKAGFRPIADLAAHCDGATLIMKHHRTGSIEPT